jgi:hypothetical protein
MKTTLLFLSVFLSVSLFGQNVYIPDANFKEVLINDNEINTNNDSEIQIIEAESFNGTIECDYSSIQDLTGIEAFSSITGLWCSNNELTSINLASNTSLETLVLNTNQITNLDLSNNSELRILRFAHNLISNIDIGQNTALTEINCNTNQLNIIDVSQNLNLIRLNCSHNQITNLDLSNNLMLEALQCGTNNLTSLDLNQNIELQVLHCSVNNLESLDLSQNVNLSFLYCNNNLLNCLNIRNGNNMNISNNPTHIILTNNPNLTCIEVDDVLYSTQNWYIESQMFFSEDCNNECSNTSGLNELTSSNNLIQILDVMGRETSFKPNTPLIYVYDDGSIEKVFSVEY